MKITIDRFEGEFAVCEKHDRQMINIKKSKIPAMAKEGDILNIENDIVTIDFEETQKIKEEMEKLTKDFWY